MRTHSKLYGPTQAKIVILTLLADSRWFEVEPQPHDLFEITVKVEVTLPEAFKLNDLPRVQEPVGMTLAIDHPATV